MEHEEMSKLGFLESNSWESEESEKKFLFQQINKVKKEAWENVVNNEKAKNPEKFQKKEPGKSNEKV